MSDGGQNEDGGLSVGETQTGTLEFQGATTPVDPMQRAAAKPPEGVPEKFWDAEKGEVRVEALLKSYTELEKTRGQKPEGDDSDDPAEAGEDEPDGAEGGSDDPAEAGEDAPEDKPEGDDKPDGDEPSPMAQAVEAAQAHYAEHGELSEDVIENLVSVGYTRDQIGLYMAGVKAQEAALQKIAADAAGGSLDDYKKAVQWAAGAWTEKQIAAHDTQIADVETAKIAATALMAAYREANPGEGKLQQNGPSNTRGSVFNSMKEYDEALAKAGNSREQRREAVEKYRRSLKAGTIKPNRAQPFGRR